MLFRMILLARLVSFGKDFRRDLKHSDWRLGSRFSAICSHAVFRGLPLLTPRTYFAVGPPRHALSNDTTGQTCLLWERLSPRLQTFCLETRKLIISDLLSTLYLGAFPCSPLAPISQ